MTPIDFKEPTHKLEDVLFDAKLQPVYSSFRFPDELFTQSVDAPHYRAVVNQNTGKIVSIVSANYKLITNKEALEMGKDVFTQLYPNLKKDDLIPYKIVAPSTLSSAHIDLVHKNVNFNVWQQETWLPFLRVTNSFNRTHALLFEVGFVRKLCSNGVLFNKKSMKLKYVHDKSDRIQLKNDIGGIIPVIEQFSYQCALLKDIEIPQENMFALLCLILKINLDVTDNKKVITKTKSLEKLAEKVWYLTQHYKPKLGMSAYSAFSIASDLVSHNDQYRVFPGYFFNVRSYFTRPSVWMEDFTKEIQSKGFEMDKYLVPAIERLDAIKNITGFRWN
jgi:hypothetical protein